MGGGGRPQAAAALALAVQTGVPRPAVSNIVVKHHASGSANTAASNRRVSAWPERRAAEMPDDRSAGEKQIPDRIDQLMSHEFIGETEPVSVQDAVAADHDRIIERPAARQTGRLQPGPVVEQAKGACRREFGIERVRIDAQR